MKPAYAKLAQRLAELEAQLKPQALRLIAFVQRATNVDALKAKLLGDHLEANPADKGRPIDWLVIRWSDKETDLKPPERTYESTRKLQHSLPPSASLPIPEAPAADVAPTALSPVERIIVTIRKPSADGRDPGEVAYGYYVTSGNTVSLTDAAGLPTGPSAKAKPGDERREAGRLLKATVKRDDGFGRTIVYPPIGNIV